MSRDRRGVSRDRPHGQLRSIPSKEAPMGGGPRVSTTNSTNQPDSTNQSQDEGLVTPHTTSIHSNATTAALKSNTQANTTREHRITSTTPTTTKEQHHPTHQTTTPSMEASTRTAPASLDESYNPNHHNVSGKRSGVHRKKRLKKKQPAGAAAGKKGPLWVERKKSQDKDLSNDQKKKETKSNKPPKIEKKAEVKDPSKETQQSKGPSEEGGQDAEEDGISEGSTDIDCDEDIKDKQNDEEMLLGLFSQHLSRPALWTSYLQSWIVKWTYLIGMDSIGAFTVAYMKYGPAMYLPLITLSLLFGLPILTMELWLGQFAGTDIVSVFRRMMPAFGGLGYTLVLLNLVIIGSQVQQSALFIGLLGESLAPGSTAMTSYFETCYLHYNDGRCMPRWASACPMHQLGVDNLCMPNSTDKFNYLDHEIHEVKLPYAFPLYQFLFNNILGETEGLHVEGGNATGVIWFCVFWVLLYMIVAYGGPKLINLLAVVGHMCFVTYGFTFFITWILVERPYTYKHDEVIGLDTGNLNTKPFRPNSTSMWIELLILILSTLSIGDGSMIVIGSYQAFSSIVVFEGLVILALWIGISGFISYFGARLAFKEIFEMVHRMKDYERGQSIFLNAYNDYLDKLNHHTWMFAPTLNNHVLKDSSNALITIYSIAGLLLMVTNAAVRLQIVSEGMMEHVIGFKTLISLGRVRLMALFGCLAMLCFYHEAGLKVLTYIFHYTMIDVIALVIMLEVLICYLYGPRRIFAGMCATQISVRWSKGSFETPFLVLMQMVNLATIGMWLLLPVVLLIVIGYNYSQPFTLFEDEEHSYYFLVGLVLILPTVLIFLKTCWGIYKEPSGWHKRCFAPDQALWGPRIVGDRKMVEHVEREFQVSF